MSLSFISSHFTITPKDIELIEEAKRNHSQEFKGEKDKIKKITTFALPLIFTTIATLFSLPIAGVLSFLAGPVAWFVVPAIGACTWLLVNRIIQNESAKKPSVFDMIAAKNVVPQDVTVIGL